jgi:hypothetical protein
MTLRIDMHQKLYQDIAQVKVVLFTETVRPPGYQLGCVIKLHKPRNVAGVLNGAQLLKALFLDCLILKMKTLRSFETSGTNYRWALR